MKANPLIELETLSQSVWLDYLRRHLIESGELARLIREDGLRGVTSNPTIFEKAISGSRDYDAAVREIAARDPLPDPKAMVEELVVEDIRRATDAFRPVHESLGGEDGFVSLEVPPGLAHDTQATVAEARRLWGLVDRPNLMIKVPGTIEGIPAIEQLTAEGVNVNITLLFSRDRYREVIEAYLRGLERRVEQGLPLRHISSVASFFVSRIDTAADRLIEARLKEVADPGPRAALQGLPGRVAVANGRLAYSIYREAFESGRFGALQAKGARAQRLLWASTGTKNPHYSDVLYVEELIGRGTINTMTPETLAAFRDHGRVRESLAEDPRRSREILESLEAQGISLARITADLEAEGVRLFSESWEALYRCVERRVYGIRAGRELGEAESLGPVAAAVAEALDRLEKERFPARLESKDADLWRAEPVHREIARNRLGWLTVIGPMREQADRITDLGRQLRTEGFLRAVLLGMGGSSLCPEVLRAVFPAAPNGLDLTVLDSTNPGSVAAIEAGPDLARTIFIVSTKSGTTMETLSFFHYFYSRLRKEAGEDVGRNFIAITDPGTPLVSLAEERRFREIFLNPPDIGGRYSALSYFGLVPAAVMGLDLERLLDSAERMALACASCVPAGENPGLRLGAALAGAAAQSRDKVTFLLSPAIRTFGLWAEQLLAESTGKDGRGLIPVVDEPAAPHSIHQNDRLFVAVRLEEDDNRELDERLAGLRAAGQPVVVLPLEDRYDLGGEFFRWEYATAAAGSLLGIDPFDEPNVQEAKDRTSRLLEALARKGGWDEGPPLLIEEGWRAYASPAASRLIEGVGGRPATGLESVLEGLLEAARDRAEQGPYLAILAYLPQTPEVDEALQALKNIMSKVYGTATTLGYGPRYLHSTGQLHKGGPRKGLFLQITAEDAFEPDIPGQPFGFSELQAAQAQGDFEALADKGLPVLRVHLQGDPAEALAAILEVRPKSLSAGQKLERGLRPQMQGRRTPR